MKTEKIRFADIQLVKTTLSRCADSQIQDLIGDKELLSVCLKIEGAPGGFSVQYGLEKKEDSPSWEYVVTVFLSHKQAEAALWSCLRRRKQFLNLPMGWSVKVDVGFRDSFGMITVWAESPEDG